MRSGTLKHRITIQVPTKASDGMGGYVATWVDTAPVWGAIWPLKGQEKIEAMKLEHEITHRIRLRYRSDLTHRHRMEFKGRTFRIIAIRNMGEMNSTLEIMAKEET